MPISTNAPFNEFGQSQILRDIEQLYLALNGAGSGGPGDGQTQDQSAATSQDSGGLPDLSGLATITYVDQAIAAIPDVSYPISIANGGTGQTDYGSALSSLGALFAQANKQVYTSGTNTFTVPAGVYTLFIQLIGGGGGGGRGAASTTSVTEGATTFYRGEVSGSGGSGSCIYAIIRVAPGEQYSFTIGAGGAKGSSANTSGSTGGDTYMTPFGSATQWLTASAGTGGYYSPGVNPANFGVGGFASTASPCPRALFFIAIRGINGAIAMRSIDFSNQLIIYGHEANGHQRVDGLSTYLGQGHGGSGSSANTLGVSTTATDGGAGIAIIYY